MTGNNRIDDAIEEMIEDERLPQPSMIPLHRPETIDAADLPYFVRVMGQFEEAQQHLQQAGQLEAQAQALRAEAQAKIGAHNSYVQHLFTKYGLTPGQDRIEPQGSIVRPS